MPFAAAWMGLKIITLSKSERERQISYNITHMWNLIFKKYINELQKTHTHTYRLMDIKNKLLITRGEMWWRGIDQKLGMNINILLYI